MDTILHPSLRRLLYGLAVVMLCVSLTACDDDDDDGVTTPGEETTLADFIGESGDLSTLDEALNTAELSDTLGAEGPYTVFAPTNAAFDDLTVDELLQNDSLLTDILQYHIVPSALLPQDLSDGQTLETLQGEELTISLSGDTIQVDGATALAAVEAENGVAYVVDEVLLSNRTAYERLSLTEATQTATQLVDSAGLTEALNTEGVSYTLFAPTNEALDAAETDTLSQDQLSELLQYHVTTDQVLTSELEDSLTATSLQGEELTLTRQNGNVFVNDAQVVDPDLLVSNGIIHVIDGVLIPPSQQDTTDQDATTTSVF